MSSRPFMQLYVSDFIGDTLHLSAEQVGVYMLFLMAMWNAGGVLPDDEAKLARVARMSIKKWRSISDDILEFFERHDGAISHNRMTEELQKVESKTQSRASAGAKGGAAKALKDKEARLANAMPVPCHSPDTITIKKDNPSLPTGDQSPAQKSKNGKSIDEDWKPSESDFEYGEELGLDRQQISKMAEDMRLWALANKNRAIARKADWSLTFKGWMRRDAEKIRSQQRAPPLDPYAEDRRKFEAAKAKLIAKDSENVDEQSGFNLVH